MIAMIGSAAALVAIWAAISIPAAVAIVLGMRRRNRPPEQPGGWPYDRERDDRRFLR